MSIMSCCHNRLLRVLPPERHQKSPGKGRKTLGEEGLARKKTRGNFVRTRNSLCERKKCREKTQKTIGKKRRQRPEKKPSGEDQGCHLYVKVNHLGGILLRMRTGSEKALCQP